MPQLIQHIDAIARQKQRDVLTVEFDCNKSNSEMQWEVNPIRKIICDWLTNNDIRWWPCGHFASETKFMTYRGQIYVDVPYDKADPEFKKVEAFLEKPDGTMRLEGAWFICYPLDVCMKNVHHDEAGFWEN